MSAIKDITDLTIQLLNSKEGRKFAAEIAKIQVLTATIQSEQAAVVEKYTEAQAENIRLRQRVAELESQQNDLKTPPGDEGMCYVMKP
jgi:cell division protein FtsB